MDIDENNEFLKPLYADDGPINHEEKSKDKINQIKMDVVKEMIKL